jgi:hypothetical protein
MDLSNSVFSIVHVCTSSNDIAPEQVHGNQSSFNVGSQINKNHQPRILSSCPVIRRRSESFFLAPSMSFCFYDRNYRN